MAENINYILFDDESWEQLLPLTFSRPVSEIRIGILTIREKWEKITGHNFSWLTQHYLAEKYPLLSGDDNILINGSVIPNNTLIEQIKQLSLHEAILKDDTLIAIRLTKDQLKNFNPTPYGNFKQIDCKTDILKIKYPWEIFLYNGDAIKSDFTLLTHNRKSKKLSNTNQILNAENIFAEEGVKAEFVTINAGTGPVYLGKDSEIMEGSVIRGPFALGEHAVIKMGAKIYGPTTIGPYSKAGGEINNSVIFAYSNKAHDGFLGNSVIGEWCNLGADTNNSNLKNNYAEVKVWSYKEQRFINTKLQFCGLIMGDHSKCGINTMFNTGTVVGYNANIFGSGFPRSFIPSFSWGGAQGFTLFTLDKAFEVAERVMSRRAIPFDEKEKKIMSAIFKNTQQYRQSIEN